ncbi:MAG: ABC transporter permease [Pirellulales bacterium]
MTDFTDLWPILGLSLQVALSAVLLSVLVAAPLGTWLGLSAWSRSTWVRALVYTGMALPPVVVGLAIYLLLSASGPLGSLGWLFTPQAMILAQTILDIPFVTGITMTAVAAVPEDLHFQARALGASPMQARFAVLREARGGLFLAVATALGRSMSEVGAVWMVGGNIEGHTRVLTTAVVLETGKGNFAFALVLGGVLLAVALALNLAVLRWQDRPLP